MLLARRGFRARTLPTCPDDPGSREAEPRSHDLHGLPAPVDEYVLPPIAHRRLPEAPAPREEIEQPISRLRMRPHDPLEDPERLLRREPGPLPPARRHDRVPPRVRRRLP